MRKLILSTVLVLGSTATWAGNGLFYLGAGVTNSALTDTSTAIQTKLDDTSWKAFAGVRPLNWLAVEAGYIDLGSGSSAPFFNTQSITTHADSSAWAAYTVGFLPLPVPNVDFYGKAGVAHWKLNSSYAQYYFDFPQDRYTSSTSHTGTSFAWGLGAQAHISIAGVRLEYESFEVNGSSAKVASLSVFLTL
jgi:OmpA-like transmembrane domain